jgi:hypothetical protein
MPEQQIHAVKDNASFACVEDLSELSTAKVATDITLIPKVIVQIGRKPTIELAARRRKRSLAG